MGGVPWFLVTVVIVAKLCVLFMMRTDSPIADSLVWLIWDDPVPLWLTDRMYGVLLPSVCFPTNFHGLVFEVVLMGFSALEWVAVGFAFTSSRRLLRSTTAYMPAGGVSRSD